MSEPFEARVGSGAGDPSAPGASAPGAGSGAATRSSRTHPTAGTSGTTTRSTRPLSRWSELAGGDSSAGSRTPVRPSSTAIGVPAGTTESGTNAVTTSLRARPAVLITARLASARGEAATREPSRCIAASRRSVARSWASSDRAAFHAHCRAPERGPSSWSAHGSDAPQECSSNRASDSWIARRRASSSGTSGAPIAMPRPATVSASVAIACAPRWIAVSCAADPSPSDHQSFQSPSSVGIRGPMDASAAVKKSVLVDRRSRGQAHRPAQSRTMSPTARLGAVLSASLPMTRRCSTSNGMASPPVAASPRARPIISPPHGNGLAAMAPR